MKQRCQATTKTGRPCRAWAVRPAERSLDGAVAGIASASRSEAERTQPPRCSAHGGGTRPVGAPKNNKNAEKHGYYSKPDAPLTDIRDVIADLARKQLQLSRLIESKLADPDVDLPTLGRFFALHGQNASRLGRLLRDHRALTGEAADATASALAQALDELSKEMGIEL